MKQDTETLNKRIKKYYVLNAFDWIISLSVMIPIWLPKDMNSLNVYFIASMSIIVSIWIITSALIIRCLYKDKDSLPKTTANQSPKTFKVSWKTALITSIVELIIGVLVLPLMIVFYIKQDETASMIIQIIMTLGLLLSTFSSQYLLSVIKELKNKRDMQIQQ